MAQDSKGRESALTSSRPKLRILVLAAAAEREPIRSALAQMAELELEIQEGDPTGPSAQPKGAVDVLMFVFSQEHQQHHAHAVGSGHPVRIALVHDRSSHAIRDALRGGADEVLFLPLDHGDVARALLKIGEARSAHLQPVHGKIVSLVSVTGGAGVTTIAANCALALAHSADKKVGLLDLDFQSGDLAVALNVEPEHSILDLAGAGLRLNSVQIESALTRHPSGVYLLAAPKRIEESEQIPAAQVGAVLDLMRQMVDFVIVDIGRHINDTSVVVWERCDELLYVLDQSIGAMRGAWRFLDLFGRLKLSTGAQPRFILNRWTPHHPINEKHVVNTLGRPLLTRIPRDDAALEHALSRGEDLWKVAPRSPLPKSYEFLAREISGHRGRTGRAGLFSRMFTRNGAHSGS